MASNPFSRLQLAAALIEYDNDPENPEHPNINARESAIFAHLRPQPRISREGSGYEDLREPPRSRRSVDYLSVALPSDNPTKTGKVALKHVPRHSVDEGSIVVPTGRDRDVMSAWGLEGFVPPEEASLAPSAGSPRRKNTPETLPNPYDATPPNSGRRFSDSRRLSAGNMSQLAYADAESPSDTPQGNVVNLRNSTATELDYTKGMPGPSSQPQEMVPFPSSNTQPEDDNPFALPPPSPNRFSRFDPKSADHQRKLSSGSLGSPGLLDPSSRERTRTTSNASFGTRMLIDGDGNTVVTVDPHQPPEDRRHTRLELMRPKVLIMPGPLQSRTGTSPKKNLRDGFFDSTDGPPLPPGSKTEARPGARPLTTSLTPSGSFNPRQTMSLSQLTFRQSLMVGGERDIAYEDIDRSLQRAENDGEQIQAEWSEEEEEDVEKDLRPAGKLYGTSLIDNLEARKAEIKGKQRVFKGDERPSMMQRDPLVTSDALQRPNSKFFGVGEGQGSKTSPLLNFDDEGRPGPRASQMPPTRSVFGVDKIWEKELAKLKTIEDAEQAEQAKLAEREAKTSRRKGKSAKGSPVRSPVRSPVKTHDTLKPPSPTPGQPVGSRRPPAEFGEAYENEADLARRRESNATLGVQGWFAGGSDEEEDFDRRASVASRRPNFSRKVSARTSLPQIQNNPGDSDEDEDVPLAQRPARKSYMPPPLQKVESDSDEDKPIAALKKPTQPQSPSSIKLGDLPNINFDTGSPVRATATKGPSPPTKKTKDAESSEDDEVPLGVKHPNAKVDEGDDDDKPLGMRLSMAPNAMLEQQQQQYFMAMQQQQMMMQAQMRNTIAMNHMSLMGSAYGPPMMGGPAMSVHSMMPSLLPLQAAPQQDFSRVDKWRREVGTG